MKPRICLCITQSELGGAQTYVSDLAHLLDPKQYDITIAAGIDPAGWLFLRAREQHIPIHYLRYIQRDINPIADLRAIIELYRFFKSQQFDIVHLNSSKMGIVGAVAAIAARIPIRIFNPHGWAYDDPRPWWQRVIFILAYACTEPLLSAIICVSEYTKKTGHLHGISTKKLFVIHNGINRQLPILPRQTAIDLLTTHNIPHNNITLVNTIANHYPTKGLIYLLQAASNLQSTNQQIHFVIIGNPTSTSELELYCEEHHITTVHFLKHITNAQQYLSAFDMFVLPSLKEGYPYALMEAACAGLPIISTNVGGIPELLAQYPAQQYTIVPPADVESLAQAIKNHLTTPRLTGDALTAVCTKFDSKQMVKKTMQLYHNLLSARD